jgi:ABC-type glycerol-3-phosphate transport system permease component
MPVEWIPREIHLENFILPFSERSFARYYLNSIITAFCTVSITLVLASLAGFSLAKYRFPGRNFVFLTILSTMILPIQVIMVPLYLLIRSLGWLDTYQGLIIPQVVSSLGLGIFLIRQHMLGLPDDYIDAARIDGLHEVGILTKVALPMSQGSISAVVILSFVANWDSFLWPLVVVTKDYLRTLPLGVALFFGEFSSSYNQALAISLLVMAPVLLLFVAMQRRFVEGMTRYGLR